MRCMNCGLPISPTRTMTHCPRCGTPLNYVEGVQQQQFEQIGWGNMGEAPPQNPWGQVASTTPSSPFAQQGLQNQARPGSALTSGFSGPGGPGLQQPSLSPRRPYPPPKKRNNTQIWFMVAGLCVILAGLLLVFVFVLGSGSGSSPSNTANTSANTPATSASTPQVAASPTASDPNASPTADASPSANGTPYPGQQYIDGAQMTTGVNQPPVTTFKTGSNMYVTFNLHPPSQGGAVCSYWYLNGNQVTSYPFAVKGTSHSSYTYATYDSPGPAYVELYWASDKTCSDKILAQHVDFTVTA